MKVVYQDLINFLSCKPSKSELSEKLFQLGHEHEINGDIFDMELTPNRGDCLSLLGLARDLKPFFGNSEPCDIFEDNIDALEIDFVNLSQSDCPQISFLEIDVDEVSPNYKPYLENYFKVLGNKKTNLFSDISNYISYELGQPTHCFDRDTIKDKLIFKNEKCDNNFLTLLGTEITLTDRNCVFSMGNEIISLAGVMGGLSTACTSETKKVLVECAYFKPESIIGKTIKYNLISDAAHKFERGVDIAYQEITLRRFIRVVQEHAKIKSIKFRSFGSNNFKNLKIPIDTNKINQILGTNLAESEYSKHLESLSFNISSEISVPSFRHDIKTNNDLAEELARIIGYDNIKSAPVKLKKFIDNNERNISKLELFLIDNGFSEVINSPFTSKNKKKSINIDNPLDSNRNNLRISLRESLIENLLYNERRQKDAIKLFEISDIYTKDNVIKQQKNLGLIVSGRMGNNYRDFSKKLDHEYLNNILNEGLVEDKFEIIEISRSNLDTKRKDKIYYIEIPIEEIPHSFFSNISAFQKVPNFIKYNPVSEYPSSTRDFSFAIHDLSKVDQVISKLESFTDEIIKDSFIFDFFKNDANGNVKLGFRFIFQSHDRTLSDEEINNIIKKIVRPILKIDGVSIPGM